MNKPNIRINEKNGRRIFYIEVGHLPLNKQRKVMDRVCAEFKKRGR